MTNSTFFGLAPLLVARIKSLAPPNVKVIESLSIESIAAHHANVFPAIHVLYAGHRISDTAVSSRGVVYTTEWAVIFAVRNVQSTAGPGPALSDSGQFIDPVIQGLNAWEPATGEYMELQPVSPRLPVFTLGSMFIPFSYESDLPITTTNL